MYRPRRREVELTRIERSLCNALLNLPKGDIFGDRSKKVYFGIVWVLSTAGRSGRRILRAVGTIFNKCAFTIHFQPVVETDRSGLEGLSL